LVSVAVISFVPPDSVEVCVCCILCKYTPPGYGIGISKP